MVVLLAHLLLLCLVIAVIDVVMVIVVIIVVVVVVAIVLAVVILLLFCCYIVLSVINYSRVTHVDFLILSLLLVLPCVFRCCYQARLLSKAAPGCAGRLSHGRGSLQQEQQQ